MGKPKTEPKLSGVGLAFESRHLVFYLEFPALYLGDFAVRRGRVGHRFGQFGLQGLMFGGKLTEMRLKAHAFLQSRCERRSYDDTELGTCRTPDKGIVEKWTTRAVAFYWRGPKVKLDTLQELAMRAKLQNLLQQHRDLDTAILSLEETGTGDQLQLRRLKKMKLDLKDKIQQIENMLIPDIIA